MASSSGPEPAMNKAESKSSVIESIKGRSMSGVRVSRGDLRRKMTMPAYLRLAIRDAIAAKSIDAGKRHYGVASLCLVDDGGGEKCPLGTPESPVVVFVNSKSGGRQGYALKSKLQNLMGEEQVLDLQTVKPHEFVEYGLGCLENFAALGDSCAKETRERLRIVVAGGDGTVGWVLGCLGELHKQGRDPVPPTAIIPLGTGNDLSRNFGWGGSFPFNWKTAIKKTLDRVLHAPLCRLDSWNLVISMPAGVELDTPHALKQTEEVILDQIIYSGYSCKQGWFFTPCMTGPSLRGLKNILRLHIKRLNSPKWELIHFPSSVRSVVALNLHSYASGRNPWGNLKPEYLEKRGFVEAKADDGLLEIFGFKQGWHASFVMVDLISAKHIAQASEIRFELRGGAWKEGFMQMDGEPWKQPMNNEYSTFLDIKRVQFQSIMIQGRTTILE